MAFKRRHEVDSEEQDKRLKEILDSMASIDDLFGSSSSNQRYMKFNQDGEAFLLVQTGEPKLVPQKNQNGQNVWLVQDKEGDKYRPVGETADFDASDYNNAFQPDKEIVIPAQVVGKKLKDGSKDDTHEPFETEWMLTRDQRGKFKDALLDAGVGAEAGTKYVVKRLSSAKKPYTYSIKVLTD